MANIQDVNVVDKIKLVLKKGIVFNNPIIIEGFQGVGLVGTLAAQYMAQKLDFEPIGYVDSEGIPPMALLINGEIKNPVKIYTNKKRDIVIIESELSIPRKIIYELGEVISQWAKKIKAKEIVCLEGIAVPSEEMDYDILGLSTSKTIMNRLVKKGIKKLENGIVIGMSAALLLRSREYNIPATCLMIESRKNIPDGMAAANLLDALGRIYDFKVDVSDLKKQANAFEKKIEKVLSHANTLKKIEDNNVQPRTSIYG